MDDKENAIEKSDEFFDFDKLESKLEADLEEQLSDLDFLEKDKEKINNPESLGNIVMNTVWEQFVNQIGVKAGEDFIKENSNLTLDLRDEAHIQTTDNFANGKIATHNNKIDYQQRYDDWQSNFQKDESGKVKIEQDKRTGKDKMVLRKEARVDFDKDRPKGSKTVNIDHTIAAAEIIRDPAANAHMTRDEQIKFANSDKNLNPLDSAANQSKSDLTMNEWLDSERNGQKPSERFNIDEDKLRNKDKEAGEEYERLKKEGEERSIKAGKQSQKEEAFRIGGKALRAVIMGLLAELVKNVISKLVSWIKTGQKNLESFINQIKLAIKTFIGNLKQNVLTTGDTLVTTIATAIIGPVVGTIKKVWMLLKQGAKSIKKAIDYIKEPQNKNKEFGILMLEVGKIVMTGLTATGAIVLGEVIEKNLMAIPVFMIEIPIIGSLANILGMFLGALLSGIIGAIAINLIDKLVAKKQKKMITARQVDKGNEILNTQAQLIAVKQEKFQNTKVNVTQNIKNRHQEASKIMKDTVDNIFNIEDNNNNDKLNDINNLLNGMQD